MSVNNIHKYKKAKTITKDLEQVVVHTSDAIRQLSKFRRYIPVQRILETLEDNHTLLKLHLKEQKRILDTKGREDE